MILGAGVLTEDVTERSFAGNACDGMCHCVPVPFELRVPHLYPRHLAGIPHSQRRPLFAMSVAPQPSANALASLDPPEPSIIDDVFALYGRQIIAQSIKKSNDDVPIGIEPITWSSLKTSSLSASSSSAAPMAPVGILGAGMFDRLRMSFR